MEHLNAALSPLCVGSLQVSDQKPLGSWAVKQGQRLSCPAVYNAQTNEYVAVADEKVSEERLMECIRDVGISHGTCKESVRLVFFRSSEFGKMKKSISIKPSKQQ